MNIANLEEIGSRLGLSLDDIKALKENRRKWNILFWIAAILTAIITFILGFIIGRYLGSNEQGGSSYPFAVSAFGLVNNPGRIIRKWHIPLIVGLGFLTGLSQPVFGDVAIDYGVYSRKGGGT